VRGKRENFFSREKKFSRSPRAPLTLSRKAKNFFIYFYLPLSETEPSRKGKGKRAYHSAPTNGRRKSTPLFSKREGQKSIPFRADQRKAQKNTAFLEKGRAKEHTISRRPTEGAKEHRFSRKGKGKRAYHFAPTNGRRKSTPLFSKREGQKSIPFRADQRKAQKYPAFLEKGWGLGKGKTSFPAKRSFPLPQDHHHPFPRTKKACDQTRPQRQR